MQFEDNDNKDIIIIFISTLGDPCDHPDRELSLSDIAMGLPKHLRESQSFDLFRKLDKAGSFERRHQQLPRIEI